MVRPKYPLVASPLVLPASSPFPIPDRLRVFWMEYLNIMANQRCPTVPWKSVQQSVEIQKLVVTGNSTRGTGKLLIFTARSCDRFVGMTTVVLT